MMRDIMSQWQSETTHQKGPGWETTRTAGRLRSPVKKDHRQSETTCQKRPWTSPSNCWDTTIGWRRGCVNGRLSDWYVFQITSVGIKWKGTSPSRLEITPELGPCPTLIWDHRAIKTLAGPINWWSQTLGIPNVFGRFWDLTRTNDKIALSFEVQMFRSVIFTLVN